MLNESGKKYAVFEIVNVKEGSKDYGKKIYIASSSLTKDNILSKIRTYADSKTSKGGVKDLASKIKDAGSDYQEDFEVKEVRSGLSRETAEGLKAKLIDKASDVYNQEMSVV